MKAESIESRRARVAAAYAQSETKTATAVSEATGLPLWIVNRDLHLLGLTQRRTTRKRGVTLTERRREVLREFLRREEAQEPPPTMRDLADHFNNSSCHAQYEALQLLRGMGYLLGSGDPYRSRAYRLTSAGREAARAGRDPVGSELDALREAIVKRKLPSSQAERLARDLRRLRERVEAVLASSSLSLTPSSSA